jgi:hypothetical protein
MKCSKTGIKIHESNNDYKCNPFQSNATVSVTTQIQSVAKQIQSMATQIQSNASQQPKSGIDLNIENYSLNDLYNLFKINSQTLTDDIMKDAKKIVLMTHPDKSRLEPKYFLFYSAAYKRLYSIYEFQNKSSRKNVNVEDHCPKENNRLLDNMFQKNTKLKDTQNFNSWFNEQFDKRKVGDSNESGYGDWLKSDEGVYDVGQVSKADMAQEFEKQKKHIQAITVYGGVTDSTFRLCGGTLLGQQDNYSGDGFTDLRQAYVESVIPVTLDDYNNRTKYRNIEELKSARTNDKPLDKDAAMKQLHKQQEKQEQESVAVAYYYAQQTEHAVKNNKSFWAELKQLTNSPS